MSDVTIRLATLEDMPEVAQVFRASFSFAMPYLPTLHTPIEDQDHFGNVVFPTNTVYVAMTATKRIIGFIAFSDKFVNHLYLLPEAQGQGIGSRLLALAQDHEISLKLWAFQRNTRALRFYEKHGFSEIHRTDGSENEEKEPDVLFEWRNDPSTPRT